MTNTFGRGLQDRLLRTSTSVHKAGHCGTNITPRVRGKTGQPRRMPYKPAIQPRVCGENRCYTQWVDTPRDTTPRVRGKLEHDVDSLANVRYNPACAGKTPFPTPQSVRSAIQPRVCGENPRLSRTMMVFDDTTPRVRGKRIYTSKICTGGRYNPACAGKTRWARTVEPHGVIQPRVCGENSLCLTCTTTQSDTTPRVRGKPTAETLRAVGTRYNPACAGKTAETAAHRSPYAIQPRVCGENWTQAARSSFATDTTPRVRGKQEARCLFRR